MPELSVVIAAREEEFLSNTVDEVLEKSEGDTEVIVILDGYWPDPGLKQHPKVTIIHHEESIGQRAGINEGVRLSEAKYMMKLDAHCNLSQGFDVQLMKDYEPDQTVVPRMYNLHVFDWKCRKCGFRVYQGAKPKTCEKCGSQYIKKKLVWKEKRNPESDYMRFDSDLKFQYWREFKKRPEAKGQITDLMSFIGACWFMSIDRYWEIDGLDEGHGSWGMVGTEIAMKSHSSGGRLVVNKNCFFGHLFRTGNGFGFPYKLSGNQVGRARKYCKNMWRENRWGKQVRPLSWVMDKFWPVPGWTDEEKAKADRAGEEFYRRRAKRSRVLDDDDLALPKMSEIPATFNQSKGIVYYTDNQCQERIAATARNTIKEAANGHDIVSVSQYPINFGTNVVLPIERSVISMFKQMLKGIEKSDAEIIFFCEHDVLYNSTHFDFTPERDDVYYYNDNVWALDAKTGQALHYAGMKQVSGLVAYRSLLLDHYTRRVAHVEKHGFTRKIGFEPGKKKPNGLDNYEYKYFTSKHPIVDIKHPGTVTRGRFKLDQYRCRNRIKDSWTLSDEIPYWGKTKGRFDEFLRGIYAV